MAAAKALALGLGKPLYGVNHLAAHVAVDQLEHGPLPEPCLALLVSGGHSSLLRVEDVTGDVDPLGATIDDAAGEAFDKVARLLGLPFPGGPHIDRAAREGDSVAIDFPRGLTLAARPRAAPVRLLVLRAQDRGRALGRGAGAVRASRSRSHDVAASFQEAVCDVLTRKAVDAAVSARHRRPADRRRGRRQLPAAGRWPRSGPPPAGIRVRVPRPGLCTDNGAMVAALGAEMVTRGRPPSALDLPADSSLPVTSVLV